MGTGEKTLKSFNLHLSHLKNSNRQAVKLGVPKGCLAIKVGQGHEQERIIVPVVYFNHPLFMQLLKGAEEEYGFEQKGTITIPCHVEEFRHVQSKIDQERSVYHHHDHHQYHQLVGCFRV
ncbi:PREDICTED: auxin-responsive protein SAUR32-like [Tarenaya hassleriana]|uniref:auxin-responsive protein SAUR32-like n=1 Tax=Tarenaya hassleriana TaxID=28532 RepID=UPI00053C6A10|nr:PREDICTED: auxin-responsive protein SAUR32-like [Tarenaya hassleriana]